MNIHEYQAKKILKDNGAPVSNGFVISSTSEIENKLIQLKGKKFVLKAQIHAGGRGKAGGIRLVEGIDRIKDEAEKMFGKVLVTHQTGPKGKEVKKLYIEEASNIAKEFYLSCLVDRASSKIAFISSTKGGVDIEKVAKENPEEIITTKINPTEEIKNEQIEQIIKPFNFNEEQKREGKKLIHSLFTILKDKDASLIEINPLIITTESKIICLDAKMNFDDNAMFRQPEIFELRDLNEEDPKEIEAKNYDLAYIKLNGSIGCMVNGAGLAMATMDIIKFYGEEPANFLDVGGGASKEKVSAAFKLILSDKNVKAILINIFGGIMRCDVLAQGVVDAAKESELSIPLVVRLAGTNFTEGKAILDKSGLKILSASDLNDAAKKVVEAIK
ncbi:MAG: ADP-forming succinate--CoA ligase subunit beta [Pelagibacterales bacterium MED-G40]|nr:MAG: ADP-forming succinate--CoA ligase subunit beta [Pelagibacterales bacterium MED-G40]|tara:strand:- start:25628 stop:26788 length:1161 start_codon:yes stop_codon:yes gene_type:complete